MPVSKATRAAVIARDLNRCQWCGLPVNVAGGDYSLQHRRARGMGGSRRTSTDQPANLLLVHGSGTTGCHGYIEANPDQARARGFRVSSGADPARVPYIDAAGRERRLV